MVYLVDWFDQFFRACPIYVASRAGNVESLLHEADFESTCLAFHV